MRFPERIVLATRNAHKTEEILTICPDWPVRWRIYGREGGWPEVEETGETYLDNALLKARAVAAFTGVAALADDSGIEVDTLGGAPGPRSARFAGPAATDQENLTKLLDVLRDVPEQRRTARYRCVAVLVLPDGAIEWAEGVCEGLIVEPPRGDGGFGYDPAFVPVEEVDGNSAAAGDAVAGTGRGRTMAELSAEEKHAISHRGRAFRLLRSRLQRAAGAGTGPADPTAAERPPA
jgi:XTP/dITP diphosphohydrolase